MDYDQSGTVNQEKKTVAIIIAMIIFVAIGYMGYRQFMKWYENELQSAVLEQQQKDVYSGL